MLLFAVGGNSVTLKGVARSFDTNQIIYLEQHNIEMDEKGFNKRIQTKYLKPDGEIFAKMDSDFSKDLLMPQILFEDFRFKTVESLNLSSKKLVFKKKKNESEDMKEIDFLEGSAAGQGFDNFIKFHFESLQSKEVPLQFGVLSEMSMYSFKAYQKNIEQEKAQFGISLTNPFYRLFAKELVVSYDLKTKQLLSYRGISNILNDSGNRQNVQIDYEVAKP